MNQEKIGKFIAERRKEQGLTQAALAEKFGISDRAVSKWETGKSMPDASIMLELCEVLEINVNELLSGEKLDMDRYRKMAEEHLLEMHRKEEAANKKLLRQEVIIGYVCSITFFIMLFAGCFAVTSTLWRVILIAAGLVIFAIGMTAALKLEHDAGYYECPNCGTRYVPTMKAVVIAPHFGRSRRMKCPYCGKRGYHKKVLTISEQ